MIDAQVFGEGSEHHTLQPVLETIKERYKRLDINDDIYGAGAIVTADTGFANEDNMAYLHSEGIDGYIPDNQFRSRDPKFDKQKEKHPRPSQAKADASHVIPASEFNFDPITLSCQCPAGKTLHSGGTKKDKQGNLKAFFRGRLKHCRDCDIKHKCMKNPKSAEHSKGYGRQVSFLIDKAKDATYTDWMKVRVDSKKGKQIYSHRMSVVEPVFGNVTANKKLKRFSLRSKIKVNAQWMMFCLIQNIEKLANYGQLTA